MLVLARQRNESILIGDDITVTVSDIRGDKVRLAIDAPRNIKVYRKEIYEQIKRENEAAGAMKPEDIPMKLPGKSAAQPPLRIARAVPRLGRVMVFVNDLAQARHFYQTILGLDLIRDASDHLIFGSGPWTLLVFRCEGSRPIPNHAAEPTTVLLFEVESIESAMAELKQLGVRFIHDEPNENSLGRYAAFVDPSNNVFEIFQPESG